jgi:hypothetical protein
MRSLVALLLLGGCAVQRLEADKTALQSQDYAAIAAEAPPCTGPTPECRQAQEIRAEACRQLAVTGPAEARRGYLACAVTAYRAAATGPAASRPLLLNLGASANDAITAGAGDPAANAAAELLAADGLRRTAPADPEGCYFAGSARLALALLARPDAGRCGILAALPVTCRNAAPVAGREAQSRHLAAALDDQHRSHGCP